MLFAMRPKVNRFIQPFALGLLLPLLLTDCSLHPTRGLKACRYRFQTFSFLGADGQATHWRVTVGVSNPNGHEVTLARLHYALLYQTDTLLSGWNPESKTIPAHDSLEVRTSLDLPHALFKRLPPGIWSQTDARFPIVADAYLHTWVGDFLIPQAIKDTVHIDMTAQVARLQEMLMKRFFGWPGKHLEDGSVPNPDEGPPAQNRSAPDGSPGTDEHL